MVEFLNKVDPNVAMICFTAFGISLLIYWYKISELVDEQEDNQKQ
jgi:hypothetical protein